MIGLVGMARRRRPEDVLLVGSAVMTAVVPLAFFGDSRFKVPVIPLLIIAAATLAANREPESEVTQSLDSKKACALGHDPDSSLMKATSADQLDEVAQPAGG